MGEHIIAVEKTDIIVCDEAFERLMRKTEQLLNQDATTNPKKYKSASASKLEEYSHEVIRQACEDTPFDPNHVVLVSGQRFPDIIADKYYGVEVKSTQANNWISTGSSIMESTRDKYVKNIYMLFAKLGGEIPQFKCRPYDEVLYEIAVTHSPRYLINMDLKKGETIFDKMGTTYDRFRGSSDSIDLVRKHYREMAEKTGKSEMPWWITNDNIDKAMPINIRLWNSLSTDEKNNLITQMLILFPEVLEVKGSPTKYNKATLWLCSCHQIIMPNMRDNFTSGGKITAIDGKQLKCSISHIFKTIVDFSDKAKALLNEPTDDFLKMINEYNPTILKDGTLYENWLKACTQIGERYNVPIQSWIEKKPVFSLSEKNRSGGLS